MKPTCNWCDEPPVRAITTRLGDVPAAWEVDGKGRDLSTVVVIRACAAHLHLLLPMPAHSADQPIHEKPQPFDAVVPANSVDAPD
jgi:hypothetical protein